MSGRATRIAIIALAGVCLLCFFWNLGGNGLFDLDEALYANCAREMALTGDYVVPRVNGEPFFEKPPLVYWAAAAFYRLLGRSELTTRLPSALATIVVVALIWRFGRRVFGEHAGTLAAFFFALSPMVFGAARQLTTDATLNLCIAVSLLAWYQARSSGDLRWYLLFWAGMALGVLAKGLPGILIPTATILVHLLFARRWPATGDLVERASMPASNADTEARSKKLNLPTAHVLGLLLFLAIALPWHLLAYRAAGDAFTSEYIVRQHLARFRGGDTSHLAPFWFFVPGFLVGAFPWSFFLPSACLSKCGSDGDSRRADFRHFLKIWAGLVFVMFSASGSKLISYILPMYPPAALLVGDWCARTMKERSRSLVWCMVPALILSLALVAVIAFSGPIIHAIEASTHRPVRMDQVPEGALRWAGHLFAAAAIASGAFVVLASLKRTTAAFAAIAAGMALFYMFAVFEGLPLIDTSLLRPLHQAAPVAARLAQRDHSMLFLKTGGARRPSALFYLPDRMIVQNPKIESERVLEATSTARMIELLRAAAGANWLALVDAGSAAEIARATGAAEVYRNDGWVILETR